GPDRRGPSHRVDDRRSGLAVRRRSRPPRRPRHAPRRTARHGLAGPDRQLDRHPGALGGPPGGAVDARRPRNPRSLRTADVPAPM
ncbi:uncharacterized protein METZ01_LOCUS429834, partial [marine metagenome]